ncbi:uncharacterized protein BP5553_00224 [Venustampulla echinocandica]|uniref:Uncharacterized protein n=1 Tax=Venustampulla echinocandica TaxID=2656787 RepID=A0A370TXI0_9HELO|nr:uncharacterized protein BP5553_00224 [Venustampulla echinocandica]RDL40245.1 hypothetical protein BP5553_00224 [Venustampulla echinocandica]
MDTPSTPEKRMGAWPPISPDTPISKREIHHEMDGFPETFGKITTLEQIAAASKYGAVILNSRDDRIKELALETYIERNCDWGKAWAEIMMYRLIGKSSAFFIPRQALDVALVEELGHAVGLWVSLAARGIVANLGQQADIDAATLADKLNWYMVAYKLRNEIQEWTRESLNMLRWEIYQLLHGEGENQKGKSAQLRIVQKPAVLNGLRIRGLPDNEDEAPRQQPTPKTPQLAKFQNHIPVQEQSNEEHEEPGFPQTPKSEQVLAKRVCKVTEDSPKNNDEEPSQQVTRKSTRLQSMRAVDYRGWAGRIPYQNSPVASVPINSETTYPKTPDAPQRVRLVVNKESSGVQLGSPPSAPKREKVRKFRNRRSEVFNPDHPMRGISNKVGTGKQKEDKCGLVRLLTRLENRNGVLEATVAEKEKACSLAESVADTARADLRKRNNDMMMTLRGVARVQVESMSQELQAIAIQRFLTIQDEADSPLQMALDNEDEARAALRNAEKERVVFAKKFEDFRCMAIDLLGE